jgi:EAL domain-containing protein (putative c-di-GMP-specific phosphodiesterase class I)
VTLFDVETGLPGRTLVLDRLGVATARSVRTGGTVALVLLVYRGHLATAAARLADVVRAGDTVARMTDDTLALIVDDLTSPADAETVAQRAIDLLRAGHTAVGVSISVGEQRAPEQLLAEAEQALARARAQRGGYELFDDGAHERALARSQADAELREAIASGELRLHYQPIVDTEDGLARGVEALVRWKHAEHGLLGPDDFVPVAEASGAIVPLGDWVLRDACRQMKVWQTARPESERLWLAVNVSRGQLAHPSIVTNVQRALAESGLAPELLYVEVAQADVAGDQSTIAALRQLHAIGVRISIDDADAGWRDAIGDAPIDMVKARPEAIMAVLAGNDGSAVVVAQRVEDRELEVVLRQRGCQLGQGYLYARPAPADELDALLAVAPVEEPELVEL